MEEKPRLKGTVNEDGRYYLVVTEWRYPTESGYDVCNDTFDTKQEAVRECLAVCHSEMSNFSAFCDPLPVAPCSDAEGNVLGAIITAKNGLDEWWFAAKVIPVDYGSIN